MEFLVNGKPWALHLWQGPIKQRRRIRIQSIARLHAGPCSTSDGPCMTSSASGETIHNADEDRFKPMAGKRIALTRALGTIQPPLSIEDRRDVWHAFMRMQPRPAVRITLGQARRLFAAARAFMLVSPPTGTDESLHTALGSLASVVREVERRQIRRTKRRHT